MSSARPTKRRRLGIGLPTDDDRIPTAQAQVSAPTATALSIRVVPSLSSSLSSLCVRVFAENFKRLPENLVVWDDVKSWLRDLPDPLARRVFSALKSSCPQCLSDDIIVANFVRGPSIALDGSLPGVNRRTFMAIRDSPTASQLQELHLTDFEKDPDSVFATIIAKSPSLRVINLRGCTKVAEKTCRAVVKTCPKLVVLDLSYTSVTPALVAPVLLACTNLEVLKAAGVSSWTDAAFAKLMAACSAHEDFQLRKLRTLKLRQTFVSDNALSPFMRICPNLRRVDLSFTLIRHPSQLLSGKPLEKLSLTSTKVTGNELLKTVAQFPDLVTLHIAALGGGQGSSAAIGNSTAMSMSDQTLYDLTGILQKCPRLEKINLVGNTKLGLTGRKNSRALGDFVRRVGRKCVVLNMSSIANMRSSDLEGLLQESAEEGPTRTQVLLLNNTAVDDDAAPFISACTQLENLAVGGTKLTSTGLFPIIDACPRLQKLDLTSCRGVRVGDRRRFFEVWEQEWHAAA